MILKLPSDIWGVVADFLRDSLLSGVCKLLRSVLYNRHITLRHTFATTLQYRLDRLGDCREAIHSLAVFYPNALSTAHRGPHYIHDVVPHVLGSLLHFAGLRALTLDLSRWQLFTTHIRALCRMRHNPLLRSVRLVLNATGVGDSEAELLSTFRTTPNLETFELEVRGNLALGPRGCQALAEFRHAPKLIILNLALQSTGIGTLGLQTLVALKDTPQLQVLSLGIEFCIIEPAGFRALEDLQAARRLNSLTIKATGTGATVPGFRRFLNVIKLSPSLRTLVLHLNCNHLGSDAGQGLAVLASAPHLETLQLQISNNALGDEGALHLSTLKNAPSLRVLGLDVSNNGIGNAGALALAELRQSKTLQTVYLLLAHNRITDHGIQALRTLDTAPFVCHLSR